MKKFFEIVAIIAIASLATGVANAQHGGGYNRGGYSHGGGCRSGIGVGLGIGLGIVGAAAVADCYRSGYYVQQPYRVYPAPVLVQQTYYQVYQPTVIVQQTGHWEDQIVGYRTVVVQQINHPAVYGYALVNNQCVPYLQTPAWVEMVQAQEPIIQQVWVP